MDKGKTSTYCTCYSEKIVVSKHGLSVTDSNVLWIRASIFNKLMGKLPKYRESSKKLKRALKTLLIEKPFYSVTEFKNSVALMTTDKRSIVNFRPLGFL